MPPARSADAARSIDSGSGASGAHGDRAASTAQKRILTSFAAATWMLSMNRIWCGSFCMITELVRMPSPKNRTPRISVPSVTPVAAKMISLAGREILRAVDLLEVGDAHRAAALFVLGLADDEPREDLAVQAAHRRRGQHALRRAAGAHHGVDAGPDDRGRDAGRQIAVANQADARAGRADVGDQLLVARRDRAR